MKTRWCQNFATLISMQNITTQYFHHPCPRFQSHCHNSNPISHHLSDQRISSNFHHYFLRRAIQNQSFPPLQIAGKADTFNQWLINLTETPNSTNYPYYLTYLTFNQKIAWECFPWKNITFVFQFIHIYFGLHSRPHIVGIMAFALLLYHTKAQGLHSLRNLQHCKQYFLSF